MYESESDYIKVGRRYAHINCHEQSSEEKEYRRKIHKYCKKTYGSLYNSGRINKQISELLGDGNKTISGIYKTLVWHYKYNNGNPEKAFGSIRIVGFVYEDAKKYFAWQEELKKRNERILENDTTPEPDIFYIRPKPICKPRRVNLFNIE